MLHDIVHRVFLITSLSKWFILYKHIFELVVIVRSRYAKVIVVFSKFLLLVRVFFGSWMVVSLLFYAIKYVICLKSIILVLEISFRRKQLSKLSIFTV